MPRKKATSQAERTDAALRRLDELIGDSLEVSRDARDRAARVRKELYEIEERSASFAVKCSVVAVVVQALAIVAAKLLGLL